MSNPDPDIVGAIHSKLHEELAKCKDPDFMLAHRKPDAEMERRITEMALGHRKVDINAIQTEARRRQALLDPGSIVKLKGI